MSNDKQGCDVASTDISKEVYCTMGRHLKVMLSAALAAAVLCSVIPGSVPTAA